MDILLEALEITDGDRQKYYGNADECFKKSAEVCKILDINVHTKEGVALFMIAHKLVRETYKHKRDNLVDICGYARLLSQMLDIEYNKEITNTLDIEKLKREYGLKEKCSGNYTYYKTKTTTKELNNENMGN